MGELAPVAFDIETSGLDQESVVTVAGFSHQLRNWLVLNTQERPADHDILDEKISQATSKPTDLKIVSTERELLETLAPFVDEFINTDVHYLTAYNGEVWNGGFDLPVLRTACVQNDVPWPFSDIAYADMMDAISRFDTGSLNDLVGVYNRLAGDIDYDPFEDSKEAVTAFENTEWVPLVIHNLADIERTLELAELAGKYVPRSDFSMKNLATPDVQ